MWSICPWTEYTQNYKVFSKHFQCVIYTEKLMRNKWLKIRMAVGFGGYGRKGFHCVCIYPDGELEAVVLLLQPVCHTPGQTHAALSITCTYAITSISHVKIHAKSNPRRRVFSLFSVMNYILWKNTSYMSVLISNTQTMTNYVACVWFTWVQVCLQ